ncbi:MAG: O-antigen ligase family protein [Pseudomonadota bacterium]|nr:O-antigen ligase family protein [Pseudomonadota bacterium]
MTTTAQRLFGAPAGTIDIGLIAVILLLVPVLGSGSAAITFALALFGCITLAAERQLPDLPRPVLWTGAAFAAFFAAELLSALVHWTGWITLGEIGENLPFLALLPFYALIRLRRSTLLAGLLGAAPWCAFAALAFALFQLVVYDLRPQGGAGNAGIFAVSVAVLFSYTLVNLANERRPVWMAIAGAGVLAAATTLILSGTRAQWPCLLLFPAILWVTTARIAQDTRTRRAMLIGLGVILVASFALAGSFREAWRGAMADIEAVQTEANYQSRLGKRFVVWQVGLEAAAEKPILGHGLDSPRRLMTERTAAIGGIPTIFNHFHNVVLNEMARAGIVGTLALLSMLAVPFLAAAFARKDRIAAQGFGLLACFHATFALSGAVNIMLDHDIMDALFLACTAICLFFVFGKGDDRPAAAAVRPDG